MRLSMIWPVAAVLLLPGHAFGQAGTDADAQRRDRNAVQRVDRQMKQEQRFLDKATAVEDALTARPSDTAGRAMRDMTRSAADGAGLCSSCETQRQAEHEYKGRRQRDLLIENERRETRGDRRR